MVPDAYAPSEYVAVMARSKQLNVKAVVRELVTASGADPSSHLERAAIALRIAAEADTYARVEVMAARKRDAASWADVGSALGMTRQAAHERFRLGPEGYHTRWYKLRSTK